MDSSPLYNTYAVDPVYGTSLSTEAIGSSNGGTDVFRPPYHPRPIGTIDPTITFVSKSPISAHSSCSILLDGVTIHKEVTPLLLTGSLPDAYHETDCPLMYSVKLIPSYWESLCQSPGKLDIISISGYDAESSICIQILRDTRLFNKSCISQMIQYQTWMTTR